MLSLFIQYSLLPIPEILKLTKEKEIVLFLILIQVAFDFCIFSLMFTKL